MKKRLLLFCTAVFATATIQAQVVAIGGTLTVDHIIYTVTNDSPGSETVNVGLKYESVVNVTQKATAGTDDTMTTPFAFVAKPTITSAGITYSVTGFETQAFASNIYITSADLSALTITSLPQQAFYGDATVGGVALVSQLKTVKLPSTVTSLGLSCFQNCKQLNSINTENLTNLSGQSAMGEMYALTSVDFSKVTAIGKRSFRACNGMTTLSLPNIVSLGDNAITSTTMTSLTIGSSLTTVTANSFNSLPALTSLYWAVADPATVAPAFTGVTVANVTLYVQSEAAKLLYKASWGANFKDVLVDTSLSTNKQEKSVDFNVYPNPTTGTVFIKSNDVENAALTVYDVNGRVVLNKNLTGSESEINLANEATGVYLIKVKSATNESVKRIVKK